jgi:hypothetical protein
MPSKIRIHVLPARPMPIATGTPISSVPKKIREMTRSIMAVAPLATAS